MDRCRSISWSWTLSRLFSRTRSWLSIYIQDNDEDQEEEDIEDYDHWQDS